MAQAIRKVMIKNYLGPSPLFSELHVHKALRLLGESAPMGRTALSFHLNLGLGAVRTLIKRLKQTGLIDTTKSGCILTEEGREVFDELKLRIPKIIQVYAKIVLGSNYHTALLVRGAAGKVKIGLEQRDAAVRAGAIGAVTLIFKKDQFMLPPNKRTASYLRSEKDWLEIVSKFEARDGDVVIISGGETLDKAEYGALAAAWTLI